MNLREFWIALQFLTRLPTPRIDSKAGGDLARAATWFPAAGLVIGLLSGAGRSCSSTA